MLGMGRGINTDIQLHLELPPSPVSLPPNSPLPCLLSPEPSSPTTECTTLQPPESAALTYDPQQQEQGCSVPHKAPGLSSKDLTPWAVEGAVTMWCVILLMVTAVNQSSLSALCQIINQRPLNSQCQKSLSSPSLSLNTNITFELEPLLDTPTAETILDNFLAGTDYSMETMESIDNTKWTDGLDDLFPELD